MNDMSFFYNDKDYDVPFYKITFFSNSNIFFPSKTMYIYDNNENRITDIGVNQGRESEIINSSDIYTYKDRFPWSMSLSK